MESDNVDITSKNSLARLTITAILSFFSVALPVKIPVENSSGPITPPDSSESDEAGTFLSTALRSAFENTAPVSFSSWAEQCGRWLYV